MEKKVRSWSKPNNMPGLIGRKRVDKSIFDSGSHIPIDFHAEFEQANNGFRLNRGDSKRVSLIFDGKPYEAFLINRGRKDYSGDSLEIYYGSNKEFKDLLNQKLTRNLQEESKDQYLDFYETGEPFIYRVDIVIGNHQADPNIWWVNQGQTQQLEQAEGILWAPLKSSNGRAIYHWDTMAEVKEGDIVLNYANGALRFVSQVVASAVLAPKPRSMAKTNWEEEGRLVRVEYHELNPPVQLKDFSQKVLRLDISQGPLDSNGNVKQGYLFRFDVKALQIIKATQSETKWPEFSEVNPEGGNIIIGKGVINLSSNELIKHINSFVSSKGFIYSESDLKNFYLSLKAKPFVILAGISGTGKTKLVRLFSEAVGATKENRRYNQIAVRPDWNDSSDLLGYNDINGKFKPGPLTSVIKNANEELSKPFIVCLDEMNLSRVEYYFSDFLSLMETRDHEGFSDVIFKPEFFANEADIETYSGLRLPPNLYIVGTVNMDETTFPFSKKVLDRANTIEFSTVNLTLLDEVEETLVEVKPIEINNDVLKPNYYCLKDCRPQKDEILRSSVDELQNINKILEEANLHVGYRVRDEICFYMIYNHENSLLDKDDALDYQLMQKILPRVQGSNSAILKVLKSLFKLSTGKDLSQEEFNVGEEALKYIQNTETVKPFPRTAKKVATMLWRFEDGFTSFWS